MNRKKRWMFTAVIGMVFIATSFSGAVSVIENKYEQRPLGPLPAPGYIVSWGEANNLVPEPNSGFTAIAAGEGFSLGLKATGSIVAWGDNGFGTCDVPSPNSGFIAVAATYQNGFGLKATGSIVAWGRIDFGACDVPSPNSGFIAVAAGYGHCLGLKANGSIVEWGMMAIPPVPEPNSGFTAIAAGMQYCLGLKANGSIVAWGQNGSGECDVPSPNSGFTAIAAGGAHSLGLKADGSIVAWGYNYSGDCKVPSPNSGFSAVAAGDGHSLGLKADGSIVAWGDNSYGQCSVPAPNSGFIAIAAGFRHSLGLKAGASNNNPPYTPSNPSPADSATGVGIHAALSWTGGDPDAGDTVTYDVYFGTSSYPPLVSHNQSGTIYSPVKSSGTGYFWKIVAWDNHGASRTGPLWDFTTTGGGNHPPYTPSNPSPANNTMTSHNPVLSWTGGDPDANDTVTYDVYFGTSSLPPLVSHNQSGTTYGTGTISPGIYYWKIVAWDNHGSSTTGPIWNFRSTPGLDQPPNTPTITGETNGTIRTSYSYTIQATDPEQDNIKYDIKWGDNTTTTTGWNESGKQVVVSHTWDTKGTYTVKVRAWDVYSRFSDWATLTVTMPCSYTNPIPQFLELLFQRFPHAFPTLRQLLGY